MRYAFVALCLAGCSVQSEPLPPSTSLSIPAQRIKTTLDSTDRIVFAGDCVTAQGSEATGYVSLIRDRLTQKYPGITVIAAGVNADNLDTLQRRFGYDVQDCKPTLVIILEGINDVRPQANMAARSVRSQYLSMPSTWKRILASLMDRANCPVVICTPALLGEKTDGNEFDAKLDQFAACCREVSVEKNAKLCDLRKLFVAHLKEHNTANVSQGVLTKDGWHLNESGNRLAADAILKAIE